MVTCDTQGSSIVWTNGWGRVSLEVIMLMRCCDVAMLRCREGRRARGLDKFRLRPARDRQGSTWIFSIGLPLHSFYLGDSKLLDISLSQYYLTDLTAKFCRASKRLLSSVVICSGGYIVATRFVADLFA